MVSHSSLNVINCSPTYWTKARFVSLLSMISKCSTHSLPVIFFIHYPPLVAPRLKATTPRTCLICPYLCSFFLMLFHYFPYFPHFQLMKSYTYLFQFPIHKEFSSPPIIISSTGCVHSRNKFYILFSNKLFYTFLFLYLFY